MNTFFTGIKKSILTLMNLKRIMRYQFEARKLVRTARLKEPIVDTSSFNNVIVSLTTYSTRINNVHLVVESIARQSVKPNKVILWLDEDEFSKDNLPSSLKALIERGLDINFCPNYKSYKKLIPTFKLYPDFNIITIDDDIIYPDYLVERFLKEARIHNRTVLGFRCHKILLDSNDNIKKYKDWELDTNDQVASMLIFPTGVGGVFYPVGSLNDKCVDYELASKLSPFADDVWFKAMSLKNKVKSKVVFVDNSFDSQFIHIVDKEDTASLATYNVANGGNDIQIQSVFRELYIKL
ncbi:glycosyl transferase [Shewanella sp. 10N.286.48.A6]|uniref:glycosyl transferase n=1 Tax=Shewanella sp. 10N.286.48.A6 TaxID=1880833 RepID=UPI000C858A0C|nr:hypothetical protein BCU55_04485 [Shewanella sp. 10N.286.48.A6]